MQYKHLYNATLAQLLSMYNSNEAANITKLLIEKGTGFPYNIMNQEVIISPALIDGINTKLLALLQHQPIQYVLAEAAFYKHIFYINNAVLIPRPETEELVHLTIATIKQLNIPNPKVLEIGTGSGCISISIKAALPQCTITAIDISTAAIEVATKNAATIGTAITFVTLDFLNENMWHLLDHNWDIIVSNPPYISDAEKSNMDKNVLDFEPILALFPPTKNALIFYEKIKAFVLLNKVDCTLLCEINEHFGEATKKIYKTDAFTNTSIIKDMQQKDRILTTTYNVRLHQPNYS